MMARVFVGGEVEDRDGAGADVGGVAATAVVGDGEHVGLRLAGGDGGDDGVGLRIDEVMALSSSVVT